MARLDNIASYLRRSYQPSPLDSAMLQRSLRTTGPTMIKPQDAVAPSMYGSIPDVGQFGTPGSLPTNSGPPDPPIGSGNYPSITIDPSASGPIPPVNLMGLPGTDTPWQDPSGLSLAQQYPTSGTNLDTSGVLSGGNRGPQGTVYGTDPNTGQPIYNVTGSPRPGFFDSKTGKVTEALGAGALNFFVPGLGFVTKAIFDAIRRGQARHNTGTDLTGRNQPPSTTTPPPSPMGPPSVPPGGALFGYRPSQGGGTPHFDYTTGRYTTTPAANPLYTTTPGTLPNRPVSEAPVDIRFAENSGTGNFTADKTTKDWLAAGGYKGAPNRFMPDARNRFSPGTGFAGQIDPETGLLQRIQTPTVAPFIGTQGGPALTANPNSAPAFNASLAQQPGYQAYMDRLAALRRPTPAFQAPLLLPRAGQGGG